MTGRAINVLGLPSSVATQLKRVRKADQDPGGDTQMHLVPREILVKFLPSLAALQSQYDQTTQQGQLQPSLETADKVSSDACSATPSASGPPTTFQPPAGNVQTAQETVLALRDMCMEKDRQIASLKEQICQSRRSPELLPPQAPCTPCQPAKLHPEPAAAVPKMRSKAPKAPAPQTGCVARRTVILPPLSRLNRAQLENLATQWEVDPRGKTVA